MSIIVNLTEKEILDTPNDYELGEKVRIKYWEQKELEIEEKKLRDMDGKSYMLVSEENGLVMGVHIPSQDEYTEDGYDKCVICGKVSPYKTTTHIDLRMGYVEGAGQGCFQENICEK
jgi:hypothetical protein